MQTVNGCSCRLIQNINEPYKLCISCRNREIQAERGIKCRACGVGIWTINGDHDVMRGLCTECYYKDNGCEP